ncbi:replication protein [Mesobacillus jeotgali]|uniref:replication protein n=1 Tax=Mesobacillus jeotgali TaxID=129985 RepID=UPI001CFDE617|nr:replication protein [Mesobacillus jeotgali]
MSNPQIEQGYTRVANEILENIMKVSLNGTQFRIVMAVWRFTYGFQRKEHELSIGFIATAISASRSQVDRELTVLIERKILIARDQGPKRPRQLRFNKDYEHWVRTSAARQATPEIKKPPKKKSPPKKTKTYEEDSTYFKMAKYFFVRVSAVAEAEGLNHLILKADLQKWSDEMRKLIEIDKQNKQLVKNVMDWVTTDSFWKTNVLSAKKLRDKFGELAIKMKASSSTPKKTTTPSHVDPRDKDIEFQRWCAEGKDPDAFDWSQ